VVTKSSFFSQLQFRSKKEKIQVAKKTKSRKRFCETSETKIHSVQQKNPSTQNDYETTRKKKFLEQFFPILS
jgi:hypothetical protein